MPGREIRNALKVHSILFSEGQICLEPFNIVHLHPSNDGRRAEQEEKALAQEALIANSAERQRERQPDADAVFAKFKNNRERRPSRD